MMDAIETEEEYLYGIKGKTVLVQQDDLFPREDECREQCDRLNQKSFHSGKSMTEKLILDACCGSRMFWFDKSNPDVVFCDKRIVEPFTNQLGLNIEIKPNILSDFTALPFADGSFRMVVFDPPHLIRAGEKSWIALKYGRLDSGWKQMIHDGFAECMRVLDDYGVLIFKWSEVQIPLKKVLDAIGEEHKPLFGHRSGKNMNTHWMAFMKFPQDGR